MRVTWQDFTAHWQGKLLFSQLTYAVPDGGIVGVAGPDDGCVDAALLALVGLRRPSAGSVEIAGGAASVAVASVPSVTTTTPAVTVREYVAEMARPAHGASIDQATDWALGAVGLADRGAAAVDTLTPTGHLRLGIAAAAAADASVVVLNLSPIHPDEEADMWALLANLAAAGRLVFAGARDVHDAMNLALTVPTTPQEV